jgi:crotonobetainyl-CoA:carnitine CoA-transferase CaiB-like acyl-CoA transferase
MKSRFQKVFLTKARDEWVELLMHANTCVAPVYSVDETFSDPQLRSRKMFEEFDHPTKGKVKQVGISIKLSDTPGSIRRLGPRKGEHTQEILQGLGYSKDEVAYLRKKGAIV